MTDKIRISPEGVDSEGEANRPRTVRYNASDPSSPGPESRPSEGLRIDPNELKPKPTDDHRLPSPISRQVSEVTSEEAETYLGAPSVGSSASEFTDQELDTQNLGVMLQDRYRLQRVLGKGGFGVVYLAHDRVLDQDVAIKVLKLGAATEGYRKRFIFEARTAAKLRHMAIVNVFDIVQTEGGLQLVMEYYPGGTVADLIKREGKIRPKEALGYIRQVALGLGLAHKKGIIHRDIKPANIFFADDQTLKLGDFGICASYENHDHTMTGEVIGTPLYMAPEQQKDSKDVDPRADIYALAMTLYHMLTGRPPRVINLDEVPPRLRPLIQQSTAYDRKERPASCQQLVAMIDQILKNWDKSDEVMRGSSTEMIGGAGPQDSELLSGGSGEMSSEDGVPRAVSTRTSDPLPSAGSSAWDPSEVTQTQNRLATGEATTNTTVIHTPNNTWSMVALVGVIIFGFLAVIFMLVTQSQTGGQSSAVGEQSVVAVEPDEPDPGSGAGETASATMSVAGMPGTTTPDTEPGEDGPEATGTTADGTEIEALTEGGTDSGEAAVEGDLEVASAEVEPWNPDVPDWAQEDAGAGARGIEHFLANQPGSEASDFTRETFLALDDWLEKEDSPSAAIFRDSARERLKQAVSRYPDEPLFAYLLGRVYEVTGKGDEARAAFDSVETLDGEFIGQFDRVILEYLSRLELDSKISAPLRSFLMTPSSLARDSSS